MSIPPPLPQLDLPSLRKKAHKPRRRVLVLFDADAAFAAAIARPMVVVSLVVAGLFAVLPPAAFLYSAQRGSGIDAVLRDELSKSGRLDKISADQREQLLPKRVRATTVALPLLAIAKRGFGLLLVAAVCFLFLQGTRPQLTLARAVAVVVVGAAPLYVHDVIAASTYLVFDLHSIDPKNPVASNPSAWWFSGPDTRAPLAIFLRGLDFFELWACALMAMGLMAAAGGRTRLPLVVVFGTHLVVMGAGAAAATSAAH